MKFLLARNPTGLFEIAPIKPDGTADYQISWIVPPEQFPAVARAFGFHGGMIPAKAGKGGTQNAISDFLNGKIGTQIELEDHDVRFDRAGFAGHARFTCYTRGHKGIDGKVDDICGTTCLRQPWMDEPTWKAKKAEWFFFHPCHPDKIKSA